MRPTAPRFPRLTRRSSILSQPSGRRSEPLAKNATVVVGCRLGDAGSAAMAGVPAGLPAGIRLSDFISLGVIARAVPPERVRQVLAETDRASERERDLPAQVMVYYAIALALYMGSSTREVLRCLLEGLRWLWGAEAVKVAGKSGISQARSRLGKRRCAGSMRKWWAPS